MWKRITYPLLVFLIGGMSAFALDPPSLPPRTPVLVTPTMPIQFGTFTVPYSNPGTITLTTAGFITVGGGLVRLPGSVVQPAQFEFKLMPGRTVYVRFPSEVTFGGDHGGTMRLSDLKFELEGGTLLEQTSTYIKFKSHEGRDRIHRLKMGGMLTVTNSLTTPGTYNSNMSIIIEAY